MDGTRWREPRINLPCIRVLVRMESNVEFDRDPFVAGDEVTQLEREMEDALDRGREIERREVHCHPRPFPPHRAHASTLNPLTYVHAPRRRSSQF